MFSQNSSSVWFISFNFICQVSTGIDVQTDKPWNCTTYYVFFSQGILSELCTVWIDLISLWIFGVFTDHRVASKPQLHGSDSDIYLTCHLSVLILTIIPLYSHLVCGKSAYSTCTCQYDTAPFTFLLAKLLLGGVSSAKAKVWQQDWSHVTIPSVDSIISPQELPVTLEVMRCCC